MAAWTNTTGDRYSDDRNRGSGTKKRPNILNAANQQQTETLFCNLGLDT